MMPLNAQKRVQPTTETTTASTTTTKRGKHSNNNKMWMQQQQQQSLTKIGKKKRVEKNSFAVFAKIFMLSTSSGSRGGRGSGGAWQAEGKSVACVRHLKEHTCGRQRDRGGHGTEDWGLGTGYSAAYYTQKERRREQLALTEMKRNVTWKLQAAPLPPTLMLPLMQTVLLPWCLYGNAF